MFKAHIWVAVAVIGGVVGASGDARADKLAIKVRGLCSTGPAGADPSDPTTWEVGDPNDPSSYIDGYRILMPPVNQRYTMTEAARDLRSALARVCGPGSGNWCRLYGSSNGGAVLSKTLSDYKDELVDYNIVSVHTAGSNEGGSPLSDEEGGKLGDYLRELISVFCPLATEVGPNDHRGGWNHNVTSGVGFYMIGGYRVPDWLKLAQWMMGVMQGVGNQDGLVAFDSAYGYNSQYRQTSACGPGKWVNHFNAPPDNCTGVDKWHKQDGLSWYARTSASIPGRVEAEYFNPGGEGYGYHDTSSGNTCGGYRAPTDVDTCRHHVGWIEVGEWLAYDVDVAESRWYNWTIATNNCDPWSKRLQLVKKHHDAPGQEGVYLYEITVPAGTGCSAPFVETSTWVYLPAGNYQLELRFSNAYAINVDYFELR